MFIGRDLELNKFENDYNKEQFIFQVVYGRRRIGKTLLINEFIGDKKCIYFAARESNYRDNLEGLSIAIDQVMDTNIEEAFDSFEEAFDKVFEIAEEERLILVIDDYQHLVSSYSNIDQILQEYIDNKFKEQGNLYLILSGSSVPFMKDNVLCDSSPLYGRYTSQMRIRKFDFEVVASSFESFNEFELAMIYGITGGIPMYLSLIDDSLSLEDNIKNLFLYSNSYLLEEPNNILKQELREPATYNSILKAIADGITRSGDISKALELRTSGLNNYIKTLISYDILYKESPIIDTKQRKTNYVIKDSMFRFWYKFIPSVYSLIQQGKSDLAYEIIYDNIDEYMDSVFADICREYLIVQNRNGLLPQGFYQLGRWWGKNSITKSEEEIDIIGLLPEEKVFVCDCRWKYEPLGSDVLKDLIRKADFLSHKITNYYIFSSDGFTEECIKEASKYLSVKLISFSDM